MKSLPCGRSESTMYYEGRDEAAAGLGRRAGAPRHDERRNRGAGAGGDLQVPGRRAAPRRGTTRRRARSERKVHRESGSGGALRVRRERQARDHLDVGAPGSPLQFRRTGVVALGAQTAGRKDEEDAARARPDSGEEDVDWLYLPREEGGRGLRSVEETRLQEAAAFRHYLENELPDDDLLEKVATSKHVAKPGYPAQDLLDRAMNEMALVGVREDADEDPTVLWKY